MELSNWIAALKRMATYGMASQFSGVYITKKYLLQTASLYPGFVSAICFFLNFFIWGKHSSGAVSIEYNYSSHFVHFLLIVKLTPFKTNFIASVYILYQEAPFSLVKHWAKSVLQCIMGQFGSKTVNRRCHLENISP